MLKNNKVRKILNVLLIVLVVAALTISMTTMVNADYDPFATVSATGTEAVGTIQSWGSIVLGVFQAVGMSVAVIMLVWLGIKYIMASPDGKAEIKKQAFAYILGAILLFGASGIIQVFKNVITEETTTSTTTSSYVQTIDEIQKS